MGEARVAVRRSHGLRWRLDAARASLATPGVLSLLPILAVFLVALLLVLSLGGEADQDTAGSETLSSILATLWQVQAAVSGIALPLLALAIQLAGDQQQAATRSHEVLTRESWIFPIAIIALLGTGITGISLVLRVSDVSVLIGMLWFSLTLAGAVFAYSRALITLFNPLRLRRRANAIIRERMSASLDESASRRLANNRLVAALEKRDVAYSPVTPSPAAWRVYGLGPNQVIIDVHLDRLKSFLESLPRLTPSVGPAGSPAPPAALNPGPSDQPDTIQWLKLIGDGTGPVDSGLFALPVSAFDALDPKLVSALRGSVIGTMSA